MESLFLLPSFSCLFSLWIGDIKTQETMQRCMKQHQWMCFGPGMHGFCVIDEMSKSHHRTYMRLK